MTKSQRRLHKLGNAIRAYRNGFKFIKVGKTQLDGKPVAGPRDVVGVCLPQKTAKDRVERWLFRCGLKRDLLPTDIKAIAAKVFESPKPIEPASAV